MGVDHAKAHRIIKSNDIDCSHFMHGKIYQKMLNKKFGMLTVLEIIKKGKRHFAKCKCDCGNIKDVRADALKDGTYISCGCNSKNRLNMAGFRNPAWKGYGEIGNTYLKYLKKNAEKRNLEFNVTINYLWELFLSQNRKCSLTGENLYFGRIRKHHETNASLDRIDNNKGYIEGNLRWVLKDINMMRQRYNTEYFIELCHMVSNYNK